MYRKKAVALIMFILIVVTTGCIMQYSWASENEVTFEQYKADYYMNYSPYKYFKTEDFKLPYRAVVEKNKNNVAYNGLINAWEIATFNLSDVTEYSKKRIGYYEAFLFDILYTGCESTNLSKEMNRAVKSVQASSLKKVSKMAGESVSSYAKMNISQMSDSDLDKLSEALNSCDELQEVFGAIGNISTVLSYASNVEDLVYKLAKIEAISHLSNENAVILRKVAASTSDTSLSAACLELAAICSNQLSKQEIIALMSGDMVATEMANWALDEIWNEVVENLTGYGIAISVGQSMGKWASGILFSTDEQVETYYEMYALYNFEDEMRKAVSYYESQYKSSNSQENAKIFNTSLELLLSTFELGCDISVKYNSIIYEGGEDGGIVNLFVSYVSGDIEKFEDFKQSVMNVDKELKELKEFANVHLYNCYADEYCMDVSDVIDVTPEQTPIEPEQVETVELELKENVFKCSDVTIRKDMTLSSDLETYGDVYIKSGTLDLNGHTLKIHGNLYEYSGFVKINKGCLEVSGDYRLQAHVKNTATDEWTYKEGSAYLWMEHVNDYVKVDGNLYVQSAGSGNMSTYSNRFTAGILELGGDFYQLAGYYYNFQAGKNHKVIFSGNKKQKVSFASTASYFNDVEFKNEDVEFISRIMGWTLQRDTIFKNGLEKGIEGTFDLNGHTMKVSGNFIQESGFVKINKGRLEVSGDYRLQAHVKNTATDEWSYKEGSAYLWMEHVNDYVKVDGNLYVQSAGSGNMSTYSNRFTAGTLELGGDFYQLEGYSYNFQPGENHKVILSGNKKQTIKFESTSSYFNHLVLTKDKETGYTFSPDNCWKTLELASEITPHKHTEVLDEVVAPTCTETGLTEGKHCSECKEVLEKQEIVPALGHNYVNGICSRCNDFETIRKDGLVYSVIKAKNGQALMITQADGTASIAVSVKAENVEKIGTVNAPTADMAKGIVAIPNTVKNENDDIFTVIAIEDNAFQNAQGLTEIAIQDTVISIGSNAFEKTSLTTVTIPATVSTIGENTFSGCNKLTAVTFEGIQAPQMPENTFAETSNNLTVIVPEQARGYAENAALSGKNVIESPVTTDEPDNTVSSRPTDKPIATADPKPTKEPDVSESPKPTEKLDVTMSPKPSEEPNVAESPRPDDKPNVTEKPDVGGSKPIKEPNATENSGPLIGTILKDSKNKVSYKVNAQGKTVAFYRADDKTATKMVIPDTVTINGINYKVTEISDNAFSGCKKMKSVAIGKYVTVIGNIAFFKCTFLKKITIPTSVVKIGKKAFYGCKKLKTVNIKTKKLKSKSVGAQAFKGIYKKAVIKVPKKQKKSYKKWLKKKGITKKMKIK